MVFVASCHSEQNGWTFHNAGVPHVICMKKKVKIRNITQKEFTTFFYINLFKHNLSVCQSFYEAVNRIRNHEDKSIAEEYDKFIIIREKDVQYADEIGENEFYQKIKINQHSCKCSYIGVFNKGTLMEI